MVTHIFHYLEAHLCPFHGDSLGQIWLWLSSISPGDLTHGALCLADQESKAERQWEKYFGIRILEISTHVKAEEFQNIKGAKHFWLAWD